MEHVVLRLDPRRRLAQLGAISTGDRRSSVGCVDFGSAVCLGDQVSMQMAKALVGHGLFPTAWHADKSGEVLPYFADEDGGFYIGVFHHVRRGGKICPM